MVSIRTVMVVGLAVAIAACQPPVDSSAQADSAPSTPTVMTQSTEALTAAVVQAVSVAGEPGGYTFSVTIASPDTGCDQYANWWEVLSPDGTLLYRRILAHSHVDEQPFSRSGGPVPVQPDQPVLVRAHMHPQGYGTQAMQGTPRSGFEAVTLAPGFAAEVADQAPQPQGCAF